MYVCMDNRFLNLWIKDTPFLDSIAALPRYVTPSSFQSVCDDKSGYDHVLLTPEVVPFSDSNGEAGILSATLFRLDGNPRHIFTILLVFSLLTIFALSLYLVHCI